MAEYENCCSSFKSHLLPHRPGQITVFPVAGPRRSTARLIRTKPAGLIARLINAVTRPGDLVVDPPAGSFVVMHAARALKRGFIGCDLAYEPPRQNQLHLSASEEYSLEVAS